MSLEEHPAQDDQQHSETEIIEELLRHIPNEIVKNISNQNCYENTERIIMFIDVSGFTAMTEMYSKHARIGIDNLSNELNTYFTKIVDHILDNRGDVLKFAGDAILASWPGYNGAIRALQCALDIQRTCSCYKTLMCPGLSACSEAKDTCSVIRELNLRIVIASGKSRFQLLQSKTFNHFLLSGDVIDQIKAIENASEIKLVIVSVQFWNILPEHVRDQVMKSIKSSNDTWLKLNISEIPQLEKKRCVSNTATKIINSYDTKFLSKFVIEPVFDKISNLEPLKYASEMRELCICFINLRLQHTDHDNRTSKINKMFDYVCATSQTYEGLMSKVIGFDKGLSFLCLFGLSDATNPYACALETAECVRCWILEDMQEFVDEVSVGVTSGLMYCGVVGHPDRHEYTTIGRKVNLAARLMCYYPDIVTCDQETMLNSKLTMDNFTPLPLVTMKGIQNNVDAFEYHKADQSKSSFLQKENLNIQENGEIGFYGRKIEIMTVCSKLIHFMSKHTGCIRNKRVNANKENQRYALIFKGEDGSGRSSLMRYIFSVLKNGPINREVQYIKCVPTRQISIVSNIGYHGLLNILAKLLNLENRGFEQRKKLYHEMKKLRNISFELDFILKEWFQMQDSFVQNTTLDQFISPNKEALKELINLVLNYLQPKQYIFLLDDLHYMDLESLRIIVGISRPPQSILFAATRPFTMMNELVVEDNRYFVEIKSIASIKEIKMHALICSIFKVQSIEMGLLKVLYQRTRGMPGLCIQALVELRRNSQIDIRDMSNNEFMSRPRKTNINLSSLTQPTISKQNLLVDLFFERDRSPDQDKSFEFRDLYCLIGDPSKLDMPTSIESAFMREYNRLSAFQKSLLSNCSILGPIFSKAYLFGTCKGNLTKNAFNTAIRIFFENQMLKCAYNNQHQSLQSITKCFCPYNPTNLPFFCQMYKFCHESIRSIVMASMTRQTIKYRKMNAITWLEMQLPKTPVAAQAWWRRHEDKVINEITIAESYPSQSSLNKRQSFMEVLIIMRIKSYEQLMVLTSENNMYSRKTRSKSNAQFSLQYCDINIKQTSNWNIVRNYILKDLLDTRFKVIKVDELELSNGTYYKLKLCELFEQLGEVDAGNRLDYFSLDSFKQAQSIGLDDNNRKRSLKKLSLDAFENFSSDIISYKNDDLDLEDIDQKQCYRKCRQRIQALLEELITHSENIEDHERMVHYLLELALLQISKGLSLSAKKILAKAEQIQNKQQLGELSEGLLLFCKAYFEWRVSKNYLGTLDFLDQGLACLCESRTASKLTDKNYICKIRQTISTVYLAKTIYVLAYRCAAYNCDNVQRFNCDQVINNAAEAIEELSYKMKQNDIQTILVLCEQFYRRSLRTRINYDFNSKQSVEDFQYLISYLQQILRSVKSVNHIYAMVCLCKGYVLLEWSDDFDRALHLMCKAFNIFASISLIDHMALIMPYMCLLCVIQDKPDIISEKLNIFTDRIQSYHLFETDICRSLYIALHRALLIDFASYSYYDSQRYHERNGNIQIVGNHLRTLIQEINLEHHFQYRPLFLIYCSSVICHEYCNHEDMQNGISFLRLSINLLESKCSKLSMLDPFTQRTILMICENQLRIKYYFNKRNNCSEFIQASLIRNISFIHERSINFPIFCILTACFHHLKGQEDMVINDHIKWWVKKGVQAAKNLRSKSEFKRITHLIDHFQLKSGSKSLTPDITNDNQWVSNDNNSRYECVNL